MNSSDIRIGQTVTVMGGDTRYIVLDRHPEVGHWWIQDATTGAIGEFERGNRLELVDDAYRPESVATVALRDGTSYAVLLRGQVEEWGVRTGVQTSEYVVFHLPSGQAARSVKGYRKAMRLARELAEVEEAPATVESIQDNRRAYLSVIEEYKD